jgi:soluble P-type ATPase
VEALHSRITYRTHLEVLESELLAPLAGVRATVNAAVAGHPDVDISKISSTLSELSFSTFSVIPYLTNGDDEAGGSGLQAEREAAVETYRKVMEAEKAKKARIVANTPKKEKLKIVPIGEKKQHE